jgi:hypothetical protein
VSAVEPGQLKPERAQNLSGAHALTGPLPLSYSCDSVKRWADQAWPLRFTSHGFGVRCWNTQRCSVIYDHYEFGAITKDVYGVIEEKPSGPPNSPGWKENWDAYYGFLPSDHGGRAFPDPVKIEWTSLDGSEHQTTVDLEAIFKDRLVLHNVKREDIPVGWLAAKTDNPVSAHILLEVNDRTVNVYFKAHVTTIQEQEPGNPRSHHRKDLILAWTHIY